jgi:hypothetical protein
MASCWFRNLLIASRGRTMGIGSLVTGFTFNLYSGFKKAVNFDHSVIQSNNSTFELHVSFNTSSVGGHQVQLISLEEWPLCQMLPQALGQIVINRMESVGIQWHGGQRVSSFLPNDGFKSTNGQLFTADRYFSCIGVVPRVDLAKSSATWGLWSARTIGVILTLSP